MAVRPRTATTSTIPDYTTLPTLFCIVRPPPSNSTHPLNLQIQLLVPSIPTTQRADSNTTRRSGEYSRSSSRSGSIADDGDTRLKVGTPNSAAGGSAISFDAIAGASVSRSGSRASNEVGAGVGAGGEELSRIPSGGSTRSRGSTNSMSVRSDTASSNGTGTATRRRVTPLLNLSFHSVLPTVVTDAGTDQRVAKFLKRGIEISNLAIIDPIDLSQPPSLVPSNVSLSPQTSPPRSSAMPNGSSAASPSTANGLFTKFKKFTLGNSAQKPPSSANPASPTSSSFSLFARSTSTSSNLSNATSSPSKFLPSLVGGNSEGAPTPRTVPLLRSGSDELASTTSHGPLPSGYAFVVRKWLRDDLVQVSDAGGIPAQNTAIRLEWVRASDREYRKTGRGRTRANRSQSVVSVGGGENGGGSSRRGSEVDPGLTVPASVPEDEEVGSSSNGHENGGNEDEDDGESSDPEDSERPFICTLFYPSSSSASSAPPASSSLSSPTSTSMQPSPSLRRLQLATLRPAPHHPKLIATLLLPPTLPSIPLGSFSPSQGLKGGVLSNETLRDLVHVSSMFVAIREGLGGLSREKDSQNIAAGLGLVKVKSRKMGRTFRGFGKG